MKTIISVIVPVYKTETTLKECISSLLNQTVKGLEIILVDDGSPDNCPMICDEYASKYDQIKVIHKENGGLSSARNAGLEVATGEFIGFVDSDDYVSTKMYQKLYQRIKADNSDICICSHYTVNSEGQIKEHRFKNIPLKLDIDTIYSHLILPLIGYLPNKDESIVEGFVCRNLYRKELIFDYRFKSEREYFAEDVISDLELYSRCKSISILNECLYFYQYNDESLSNKYRPDVSLLLNHLLTWEADFLKLNGIFDKEKERIYSSGIKFVLFSFQNIKKGGLSKTEIENEIAKVFEQELLSESIRNISLSYYNLKMKVFIVLCRLKWKRILLKLL
ncbi:glycosyltransferase [Sellimonas catena]|uniref:Glycosyltransferase 2-like domain-containing protein n=1 Tax=Sellimonas catena TaxID=2994035 RepID=A0A9W6CKW8_9FIRM|nr:glycosyltransferase [Sellimonas catena]GLG91693.1 hypothetical protein Selli2_31200 [Sellimonas catena]